MLQKRTKIGMMHTATVTWMGQTEESASNYASWQKSRNGKSAQNDSGTSMIDNKLGKVLLRMITRQIQSPSFGLKLITTTNSNKTRQPTINKNKQKAALIAVHWMTAHCHCSPVNHILQLYNYNVSAFSLATELESAKRALLLCSVPQEWVTALTTLTYALS